MRNGTVQIEALEHRIQNDWAVLVTRTELQQDGTSSFTVRDEFMLRTDGLWKAVPEGVRSDSAVVALLNEDMKELFRWYRAASADLEAKYGEG